MVAKGMGTYRELAEKGKSLESVLENKEYSHGEYCHYTTLDTINKIIKGKSFMLGSANGFNDDCDKNQFENPKQSFALCFATGVSENLPMWQIYAGCNQGKTLPLGRSWKHEAAVQCRGS